MKTKLKPFQFKQFSVEYDRCAMKVDTDGVLLGAWTEIFANDQVLDIGAGSGLIALMLAQRGGADIDAVEIDSAASEQAKQNFLNSVWAEKLTLFHSPIESFCANFQNKYDLIVSNPPYFKSSKEEDERNIARAQNKLSHSDLLFFTAKLLHENGRFAVILPYQFVNEFIDLAAQNCLFLSKFCEVKGRQSSKSSRALLQFGFSKAAVQKTCLTIETAKRHEYTSEYRKILSDYLTIF